ncbi:hypothetical protein CRG98_043113 [Punica granatum]|uniref:Uncharacterized protein n=1 Tax=Punica granatum TaxID=22663 RepID=A0A2I0HXR8_PUNGR|nr:hypothetical protein CRG98_043113 [Punica granatum]
MPPRRRDRVDDVLERDNRRQLEQRMERMEQVVNQRMDRMMEQFTQQMATLLENQNRRNPNPNSDLDREEIEYDSNSEGGATLFSEENPSDEAFFVAGGDGDPEFDKEEEIVTDFNINDSGLQGSGFHEGAFDDCWSAAQSTGIEGRSFSIRAQINGSVTVTRVVRCVTEIYRKKSSGAVEKNHAAWTSSKFCMMLGLPEPTTWTETYGALH